MSGSAPVVQAAGDDRLLSTEYCAAGSALLERLTQGQKSMGTTQTVQMAPVCVSVGFSVGLTIVCC